MKNSLFLLLAVSMLCLSCNSSVKQIFSSRTPQEAYAEKVEKTAAGQQWIALSKQILENVHVIELPYRQQGFFPAGKPHALALQFTARQGEKINFQLGKPTNHATAIFADVFKQDGSSVEHLLAADTSDSYFGFEVKETGTYTLRLQPELNHVIDYNFTVTTSPSLGFPVAGNKARTGSFWGDPREAGKRSHEGVDIFAAKGTPVVAGEAGYISKVANGGIGGKTVWLKAMDRNISLYYAHLDQQWVQEGQTVSKGDTLGTVGNTGNAKYTPAHLHFGIYTWDGPTDPFPYINREIKMAPAIKNQSLTVLLQLKDPKKLKTTELIDKNTVLTPLAITADGYIAELPGGKIVTAGVNIVRTIEAGKEHSSLATGRTLADSTRS